MRIAMVSEHASPASALGGPDSGGQNVYVARLSEALARRGHDIVVYTRRDRPELPRRMPFTPGVMIEHVPAGPPSALPKDALFEHMPGFGAHLSRAWSAEPPDVAHAHFWMSGMATLIGAHTHGIPVVQTFHALGTVKRRHQGELDTSPYERIGVERRIGRECSRILATCTDEVFELSGMGVPPRHAAVVPCGVDVDRFCPDGGSDRSPDRRARHRLLAIGRLVPRKGFDQAIRTLARTPDAELLIAGGPRPDLLHTEPEAERLQQLAAELGVGDRVRLLGAVPRDHMPDLIRSADLVLCTPVYEPFGIVPLEAMACGVPVVATRVGGHLDTVADGVTGRLVEPGDTAALADAVRTLLQEPEVRRGYGAAGHLRAVARFSWERVADGAEQVYAQAAARHRVPTEVVR